MHASPNLAFIRPSIQHLQNVFLDEIGDDCQLGTEHTYHMYYRTTQSDVLLRNT